MPANLTPDYRDAEQRFKQARSPEEKLTALKRMLSTIPKHKGTEKLQADIKRRIARLNDQLQSQSRKKGFAVKVEREGVGQIALVGPPNAGKSRLAAALSGVELEVAPYPYSTQKPCPAMMPYEDVRVQLVDLPPVSSTHTETWVPSIVRTADAVLMIVDLASPDVLDDTEDCLSTLEGKKIRLVGGDSDQEPWASVAEKKTRLVGAKLDLPNARETWNIIEDLYGDRFEAMAVSAETAESIEELRLEIFRMLRVVRVYSKPPGHEPDKTKPFVLPEGSTLMDFARTVHHDFENRLKFARVWGHGKFDGQRATKAYPLADGDVIELHA
jgi:ribosome-interacting GTPase 1